MLATALINGSFGQREGGHWSASYALGEEGLSLVTRDSAPNLRAHFLLGLAETDARRGAQDACRRHTAEARAINEDLDLSELEVLADRWDAALDLGLGRLEATVERLERTRRRSRGTAADHSYHSPVPDLVEAYVRLGSTEQAAALVPEFERLAPPGSFPPARAALLWTQGMVAPPPAFDAILSESAAQFGAMGMGFHQARVLLVLGERRRRDGSPAAAREALRGALARFDEREARPWSDRARSELAATGDRRAAEGASRTPLTEELTAQELQIAMLVAQGMQNRDIAGALFLSVRTVEFHLTRVYRKLGVRGRAALAHRLANAA
jgi:DNA-binding CsgD family transcriptional regulator